MKASAVPEVLIPRMERLMERLIGRRGLHHVLMGMASADGTWDWTAATGEADPQGAPATAETPWFIASVTKLLIATVVLRLGEQGVIDVGAPITEYLPEELAVGLHVLDGVDHTSRITLRHLLGHLSGLPDYLDERPRRGPSLLEEVIEEDRSWSFREAVLLARDRLRPHFPPSDLGDDRPRIRYSDTNFVLLMVIVEHVTGRRMADLYRESVFEPFGLRRTWYPGEQPADPVGNPATIWLGRVPLRDRPMAMRSFGDLYSTLDDMLRFGRALFGGETFENRATVESMYRTCHRFGFPRSLAGLRAPSWPIEYGLGMMRFELSRLTAGGRRIPGLRGHTGSTASWLWHVPRLGLVLTGTVDQAAAATVPFRAVPRALEGLGT